MNGRGYVYLLHLDRPINPDHPCRHYIGYAVDLGRRISEHRSGGPAAARLLQVASERGIGFTVARVWRGNRALERRLKNSHHGPAFCPHCGGRRRPENAKELTQAEITRLTAAVLSSVFALPGPADLAWVDGAAVAIVAILVLVAALAAAAWSREARHD